MTGAMHSTAQMTVVQNGLAPGNDAGAWVATSTASGIETKEMLRMTFALGEMSRTSPEDCRAKLPEPGVVGFCEDPTTAMTHRSSRGDGSGSRGPKAFALVGVDTCKGLCAVST